MKNAALALLVCAFGLPLTPATAFATPILPEGLPPGFDDLAAQGLDASRVEACERYTFYDKVKAASLIVQSGELTAYGNAMFCKAVIVQAQPA
jgi:hypothetical protein